MSSTSIAPIGNVTKTRPVMKSFIPDPAVTVLAGGCDNEKVAEEFKGDARGPGIDEFSARTTAFWDFFWGSNSAIFDRRVGPTVRLASSNFVGQVEGEETLVVSEDTVQGSTGFHYLLSGTPGTEGFRGVDLRVASPNPFCSDLTSLAINQDFGQTTATTVPYPGRAPFWERDGSYATSFAHDGFPAHELYTYNYLSSPAQRVVSGAPYFYTPPSSVFAPICLLTFFACPKVRGSVTNP